MEEYCYKEIKNVDILVCIVGGRFGSESRRSKSSITQLELKTAQIEGKQVYVFIEENVLSEYETYLLNKDSDAKYRYVDDKRIYEFIEEIKLMGSNNVIKGFGTASDIVRFLKEQWAGLFQRLLDEQSRIKEVSLIRGLEKTAQTLNRLVSYLSDENKDQAEEINRILMINHPLVERIRAILKITYNFYFEGLADVSQLLHARRYVPVEEDFLEPSPYYQWLNGDGRKTALLSISKSVFEDDDKLKFIRKSDWNDEWVVWEVKEDNSDDDDLPF